MANPVTHSLSQIGSGVLLMWRTFLYMPTLPRQMDRFIYQCYSMGYNTLPLVGILSFFIGAVLALQIGYSMRSFAVNDFIGAIVGLSLVRELAPVMTAIMLAGRVGSAITAELASMRVYQEVDALITMNIPPERFLVVPRVAAILVVMPVLTIVAVVSGWIGGQLVAEYVPWIGLTPQAYYNSLKGVMTIKDVTDGLIKAEIFALMIAIISCNVGLNTKGGPREIGSAVTRAVVSCIIFILILDYFITNILI
jgi:phospholipid/cholesterol/gamma-HCH transport system permease protein